MVSSIVSSRFGEGFRRPSDREDIVYLDRGQLGLLNATGASGFDVDAPIIRVSWEDVGSGVVALFATVVVFGLGTERRELASRVVGAAAIAGLVAMVLDVFV